MTQMDMDGCMALLRESRTAEIVRLQTRERHMSQAMLEAEAKPIEPTAGMKFMQLLDSMADEIRALVLSSKNVVLLDWQYYEGDSYAPSSETLIVHPVLIRLGIYSDKENSKGHGDRWDRELFLDFKAWMRCRYPRLVSVHEIRPDEDSYPNEDFHKVELQRS